MPHVAALALVVGAVVFAYANAPWGGLVFDARVLVAENPILRQATAGNVWFALTHDYWQPMATDGLYRPLTILSFLVDQAILGHGDRAAGYVIENVGLHAACACLVYGLVWRLVGRRWPATVAGLLFAVHPVATEAVTNVVGRADLLATAGVLGGLVCWGRGRAASGGRRALWASGLAVAVVTALFSKESGLVVVPAMLLHDLALDGSIRRIRAEHVIVGGILAGYLLARWWVDRTGFPPEDLAPVDNPLVEAPFWLGRLTAVGVLVRQAALLVWPATLRVDYSYRQIPIVGWPPGEAGDWVAVGGVAGIPLALWALARVRRREPAVFFLGALAALAVLPSANLLRLIGSIMAERFLYLPLAGVAGMVAVLVDRTAGTGRGRVVLNVVVAGVALGAIARTAARNLDWRDDRSLWAATVVTAPESAKAHKAYATAIFDRNGDQSLLADVVAHGERAVAIRPDYEQALVDLGSYDITLGDVVAPHDGQAARRWYEKAATALETARGLDERATARFVEKMKARGHAPDTIPDVGDGVLYNNLSLVYVKLERLDLALEAYERMRRLAPTNAAFYRDIATLQGALGRADDAAVTLFEALAIDPDDVEAKKRLAELYRTFPPADGPIVTDGAAGDIQIHTAHPTVRRHRCRAWRELTVIFTDARLPALAASTRAEAAACGED
jgi:tetratricopeptide (TPR) repeat protein